MPELEEHSLIVVAVRLPTDRNDGTWEFSLGESSSAVASVADDHRGAWIGRTGSHDDDSTPFNFDDMRLIPILLSVEEHHRHHEGFCNAALWPLHHGIFVAPENRRSWRRAYRDVNARFAQAAVDAAAPDAMVWVHDYHLQLVPEMIRAQRPDVRIGFFDIIPFPPVEKLAQLPWRDEILNGILGADVIGFQHEDDAFDFRRAVPRLLGTVPEQMDKRISSYPASIDVDKIRAAAQSPSAQEDARLIRKDLGEPDVLVLGVDMLDCSRGILHLLLAFEELLIDGLVDPATTCLVQITVSSREGLPAYQELRDEVEHTVARINGRFSTPDRNVVDYSHRSYSAAIAVALQLAADMLPVTSLRDGMNLAAKEFVTARRGRAGALVLSEFTGAADELSQAVIISLYDRSPYDRAGLKDAIHRAAEIATETTHSCIDAMADTVTAHDARDRAETFLADLTAAAASVPMKPAW
jgi:trehalose 6-phosphate synthase